MCQTIRKLKSLKARDSNICGVSCSKGQYTTARVPGSIPASTLWIKASTKRHDESAAISSLLLTQSYTSFFFCRVLCATLTQLCRPESLPIAFSSRFYNHSHIDTPTAESDHAGTTASWSGAVRVRASRSGTPRHSRLGGAGNRASNHPVTGQPAPTS